MYRSPVTCKTLSEKPNMAIPRMRKSWLEALILGSLVIALSMGVRQVSGLFLRPVAADLGMSREAFGIAVALQNLVWGLAQPVAGLFADRYGARPVVLICGIFMRPGPRSPRPPPTQPCS